MQRLKNWRSTLKEHDTAALWGMLLFLCLFYLGPAAWATYKVVVGPLPPVFLPVLLVLLAFSLWLAQPICGELRRRPWTPLFNDGRDG